LVREEKENYNDLAEAVSIGIGPLAMLVIAGKRWILALATNLAE
jgi:hypothetical protein